jgi:hypothetical protein
MGKPYWPQGPQATETRTFLRKSRAEEYRNILIHLFGTEIQVQPVFFAFFLGAVLFFLGISPILLHILVPSFDIGLTKDFEVRYQITNSTDTTFELLG